MGSTNDGEPPAKRSRDVVLDKLQDSIDIAAAEAAAGRAEKANRNAARVPGHQRGRQAKARSNGALRNDGTCAAIDAEDVSVKHTVHFLPGGKARTDLRNGKFDFGRLADTIKAHYAKKYPEMLGTAFTFNTMLYVFQVELDSQSDYAAFLSVNHHLSLDYNDWDSRGFMSPYVVRHTARPGYLKHAVGIEIATRQGKLDDANILISMDSINAKYNNAYFHSLKQDVMLHPGWPNELKLLHSHEVDQGNGVRGIRLWIEGAVDEATFRLLGEDQQAEYIRTLAASIPEVFHQEEYSDGSSRISYARNLRDDDCNLCGFARKNAHTPRTCCFGPDAIESRKRKQQTGTVPKRDESQRNLAVSKHYENTNLNTLKVERALTQTEETDLGAMCSSR